MSKAFYAPYGAPANERALRDKLLLAAPSRQLYRRGPQNLKSLRGSLLGAMQLGKSNTSVAAGGIEPERQHCT